MAVDVAALYTQYGPMVLRRCRALLKDEERAVEAMQDTFVQVLRRQGSMEISAPSSLLYRIATNTCLNLIRTKKRHPEDLNDDLLARIASANDGEGQGIARIALTRIFAKERPSTRTMAVMHLLDGMTLEEVAHEHGLSVSGVRKRLRILKNSVQELEALS